MDKIATIFVYYQTSKIRFSLLFTLTNLDFDLQGREN